MASLFGELAKETGATVKDLGLQKREDRHKNEEEAHRTQLEKMRLKNQSTLLDKRISADDKRQARQIEANRVLQEQEQAFTLEGDEAKRTADWNRTVLQEQSDMWQAAMGMYMTQSKNRSMSGGGWDVKFNSEQVLDENGQMVMRDTASVHGFGMEPMTLKDGRLLSVGQTKAPELFTSPDHRKKAEDDLKDGTVTPKEFRDLWNYIPADFVFGQVSSTDKGFQNFLETENIRLPMFDNYLRDTGKRMDGDREYEWWEEGGDEGGPGSTSEASADLAEIAEREGREPTREEANAAVAKRRKDAGVSAMPEHLTKFNQPYQPVVGGKVSDWGEGVAGVRNENLLSQGQAQAGETPAPLETGGQLGPTRAAAEGMPPMAAPTELDEAGASGISGAIQKIMGQSGYVQGVKERLAERESPKFTNPGSSQ
jgi:hypothetical protein